MDKPNRPLKVFLCHAHADRDPVRTLHARLTKDGVDAWLDKEKLFGGQNFEYEIRKAVRESDVVIVCLSKEFNREGFRQKEVKWALDAAMNQPEGEIFIIPLRLEECETLDSLRELNWVDLFEDDGYEKLTRALQARANKIGTMLQVKKNKLSKNITSPAKKEPKTPSSLPNKRDTGDSAFSGLMVTVIFIVAGIVLSTQSRPTLQFLYNLVHWQYFGILAMLWVVVDIVWIARWTSLVERAGKVIAKPWIFRADEEPNVPPLYPRIFLEQLAMNSQRENKNKRTSEGDYNADWIEAQRDAVFDLKNPLRSVGYLISLALFLFFLLADAIIVSSILELIGTISFASVPEILQRLDIAFLGGVVFTILTSVWALVELSGTGGVINSDSMTISQKTLYKWIASMTIFFSVVLMFSLAVQRLMNLKFLVSTPAMEIAFSFISYALLAVNTFLSATLTFQPAISGLIVLIYLLLFFVFPVVIFPALAFLADVYMRVTYIVVDVVLWIIFTPIMAVPYEIGRILRLFNKLPD